MSRTTYIACETCKEYLWIGQSNYIYTGEPKTMQALNDFLQKHISYEPTTEHKLLFIPEPYNGAYENEDWEDVTDRSDDE